MRKAIEEVCRILDSCRTDVKKVIIGKVEGKSTQQTGETLYETYSH